MTRRDSRIGAPPAAGARRAVGVLAEVVVVVVVVAIYLILVTRGRVLHWSLW